MDKQRFVCESDGVVTECWLEGGKVCNCTGLSAGQTAPSVAAFAAAAELSFSTLVPKLESELGGKEVADLSGIELDFVRYAGKQSVYSNRLNSSFRVL